MSNCVLFNDKGEFVNLIIAKPTDWVPEGWRLEEVPLGYIWNGKEILTIEAASLAMNKQVTPEVI
jgi:hypothetical protein